MTVPAELSDGDAVRVRIRDGENVRRDVELVWNAEAMIVCVVVDGAAVYEVKA